MSASREVLMYSVGVILPREVLSGDHDGGQDLFPRRRQHVSADQGKTFSEKARIYVYEMVLYDTPSIARR